MTDFRPEVPLQVITPADTRDSIRRAKKSLEAAAKEIVWQIEMEGWRTLGYSSWGAMREAEYGGAAFMVPSKAHSGWQGINSAPDPEASQAELAHSCEGCGQGMTGRADKRFCSSACRQKAYRNRESAPNEVSDAEFLTELRTQFKMIPMEARRRGLNARGLQIIVDDARAMIEPLAD